VARWTEPLAAAYCGLMRLPPAENAIVFRITLGYETRQQKTYDDAASANQLHLDSVLYSPAYVEDDAWQVRQTNSSMRSYFTALRPGANVMIWALTDRTARVQLVDWEEVWGPRMFAQLRTALYLARGDLELEGRLEAVIDRCREDPDVERFWQENAEFHLGAMGDVRRIDVPATGLITVRLWAAEPIGHQGWRMISMHRVA
jgi:hypothetical protein